MRAWLYKKLRRLSFQHDETSMSERLKMEFAQSLIDEIEDTLEGAVVRDVGNARAVISMGRILAITPKTDDITDDVDRLCGFIHHMLLSHGKILAPRFRLPLNH